MSGIAFPDGWRMELLVKSHNRRGFSSGQPDVDSWLRASALQSQNKRLSVSKVLLDANTIIGFYTLAISQVDFSDLPSDVAKKLPRRQLPVAVLAWLGIDHRFQGKGLGRRLLATALLDCHEAGSTFAFVAVILDCVDDAAKELRWMVERRHIVVDRIGNDDLQAATADQFARPRRRLPGLAPQHRRIHVRRSARGPSIRHW